MYKRMAAWRMVLGRGERHIAHVPPHPHACACRDLAGNQLKGPLPSDWAVGMDSLRSIDLSSNALTGQLPPAWVNLTRLQSL